MKLFEALMILNRSQLLTRKIFLAFFLVASLFHQVALIAYILDHFLRGVYLNLTTVLNTLLNWGLVPPSEYRILTMQ